MNRCCSLCGSTSIKRLFPCEDGHVLRCTGCGLVFLSSIDKLRDESKKIYSEDYYLEREDYFFKDGVVDGTSRLSPHVKDFLDGLSWIELFKRPPGRLLDVGCAMGTFLQLAKEKGWDCSGVEISGFAAEAASKRLGVEVFNGTLREAGFAEGSFDVVTLWDTIEHLSEPLEEVKEIRRILRPGGLLLVNTPNEDSFMKRTARFLYSASKGTISSPVNRLYHRYHLYYFSDSTMEELFKRAGLQVVDRKKKVIPITKGRGSTLAKAVVRVLSLVERLSNTGYELFYIARRGDAGS